MTQRPFKSADELFDSASRIWHDLQREDWLEAFATHPRIGEKATGEAAGEQAGMAAADDALRAAMAQANRDYEERFGWIYLVCATGRSAEEMLTFARRRMANPPDEELKVAAGEQERITRLRLEKLLELGSK